MNEKVISQIDAQQRVEQIHAFNKELAALQNVEHVTLPQEQTIQIHKYHQQLLNQLSQTYDVDISSQTKQLSLGMKIASLLGALAMAISIFFLFYQFWGYINTKVQVVILIVAPILLLLFSLQLAQKDNNAYFAKIAALVSLACFVLNISMLGQIFNITPSPNAFIVWSAFSFLLAYACNARLLLFFAIVSVSCFIAIKVGAWNGIYWQNLGSRPENFFLPSFCIFIIPKLVNQKPFAGFATTYRAIGLIMAILPIYILSFAGRMSYLNGSTDYIEGFYLLLGFFLSATAIWQGVKRHFNEMFNIGIMFFILFLFTKLFEWCWDLMPKYLFFFTIGLVALLVIHIFKRIRFSNLSQGVVK